MKAIWMRARSELRRSWRSIVALVLLAGLPGGVAVASAIGASRTDSVFDRLSTATKPPDIFMVPAFSRAKAAFGDVARLKIVSESLLFHQYPVLSKAFQDLEVSAPRGAFGSASRVNILSGRLPRSDRVDEAAITFRTVGRYHWKVGTRVSLQLAGPGWDPTSDATPPPGPTVTVRVVGVVASGGDFASIAGPGMLLTPAFEREFSGRVGALDVFVFSLHGGPHGVGEFEKALNKLAPGPDPPQFVEAASDAVQIKRAFHLQAMALWVMCAFLGAVSILIIGQSIARQAMLEAADYPALRALGMTRGNLAALGWVRAGVVSLGAGALALLVGVGLSPLTPLGTAHFADPQPGLWSPLAILALSAGIIVIAVVGLALAPSWRAADTAQRVARAATRPSVAARFLSTLTSRPSPTIGARFALEPGRGITAVPVRSSLAAAVVAIVAILTALTVGASVRHLAATPKLYGQNFDAVIDDSSDTISFSPGSKDLNDLTANPSISDAVVGQYQGGNYRLNGRVLLDGVAFDAAKGDLEPVILEGRAPKGPDEVVVGRKSLQEAGARVGSEVTVGIAGFSTRPMKMHVVGVTVLPFDDDVSTIGQGLWMTRAGFLQLIPGAPSGSALIRFAPGTSHAKALAKLQARFGDAVSTSTTDVPNGVLDYRRISQVPFVLAGLLALLATGTLGHMLVSSIRRRRRDLAILKTLGFVRGQLRSAVNWQATVFTALAFVIASPLSIVAGRWTWNVIARYGGFAAETVLPAEQFAIVGGSALVLAVIIALWPARAAARTPAAVVLRTE